MNLVELKILADWVKNEVPTLVTGYQKVQQVLQHNATQQSKQPLAEHFNTLRAKLDECRVLDLNREQRRMLSALGAKNYVGPEGVDFLATIENSSNFDPATEAKRAQDAVAALQILIKKIDGIKTAFDGVDIPDFHQSQGRSDETIVRVEFRDGACISNVKELRYWSNQWYDISRGVALAVGQAPEDIRIISAGRGSILLDLAMTLACARLFTGIVASVTKAAMDVTKLQIARDGLRRERLITDAMETEFKVKEKALTEETVSTVVEELTNRFPDVDGEATEAVTRSVNRLLNFQNRGGSLDFTPPEQESVDGDEAGTDNELLEQLQEEIYELRSGQNELRRLTREINHPDLED